MPVEFDVIFNVDSAAICKPVAGKTSAVELAVILPTTACPPTDTEPDAIKPVEFAVIIFAVLFDRYSPAANAAPVELNVIALELKAVPVMVIDFLLKLPRGEF